MSECLVSLIGGGPGDPELLTLKGKRLLSEADVIIYDHLVNAYLLRHSPQAEIIYAGKKAGQVTIKQSQINQMLIDYARAGKKVVRLKGGDPFLFGRGGEEAEALNDAGIPFVVVPGVTSPLAVSAYAGIPLTHRDYSSSISIVTGSNEKNNDLKIDWEKIAGRSGTLVFLMGARKIKHIAEKLMQFGKAPSTPIAVVEWGTTPKQKTSIGTLESIIGIAAKEDIRPPALTIVGDVVNLKPRIDWYENQPLFGKTIVVTRAQDQSEGMEQKIISKGAEAFLFPVIKTVSPDDQSDLDRGIRNLSAYDGIIFTSSNGVRFFIKRLYALGFDVRELKGLRIYCIGPKTAESLSKWSIAADVVPEKFVAESLIESIGLEKIRGKNFLLPRAKIAREILPETLRQKGATVDVCPAYQTVLGDVDRNEIIRRLMEKTIDCITFTSSSTVDNFLSILGDDETLALLENTQIAVIGPITEKTAQKKGLKVGVTAKEYTVDGLLNALENHFEKPAG